LRALQHSLPPRAVCCVAIQCLDMLEALHTKSHLVHRDLKPANLLARTPQMRNACFADALTHLRSRQLPLAATPPQQLHLIDFGITCKISAPGVHKAQDECAFAHASTCVLGAPLTLTCARRRSSGTVLYSHRGAALGEALSFRDDLEALGYTLLQLAVGVLPWEKRVLTAVSEEARPSRWVSASQSRCLCADAGSRGGLSAG
jgi:serine/threonine protein kinase